MKPLVDYNSLVILGSWNKGIFTPDWVSKYLLPKKNFKSEFVFESGIASRFSTDNFRITAFGNKLIFSILKYEDSTFKEIHELSFKIVDYLPHTPITAFGANFIYECDENELLNDLFKLNDSTDYSIYGLELNDIEIQRKFNRKDHILNFLVSKKDKTYKLDFNFHFTVKSLIDFKSVFDLDTYLSFKKFTLDLVKESYKIS
jgi:hypothetical protein